jgi:choline-glycine betaine transporter
MSIKPPLTELPIKTADSGFYKGFTKDVTVTAKLLVGALILWAVAFPDNAASVLKTLNSAILASFNYWYVYVMAFYMIICIILALWPASGRLKLGNEGDTPEFSNFSWFSMIIGALPFSIVMALMAISLIKAIYRDGLRAKADGS